MANSFVTPEMLADAQKEQLRKISYRIREKDKDATASPAALGIARQQRQQRQPRAHRKQRIEDTVWKNDLPHAETRSQSSRRIDPETPSTMVIAPRQQPRSNKRKGKPIQSDPSLHTDTAGRDQPSSGTNKDEQGLGISDLGPREPLSQPGPRRLQDSRWATKASLKPIKAQLELTSNAWGSELPSDASQGSGDSLQPLNFGKMIRREPDEVKPGLTGWDGKMLPPPVDWQDRPRFNNNDSEFKDFFARWQTDVKDLRCSDLYVAPIPVEDVENLNYHPDGIGMVTRTFTINEDAARNKYGYEEVAADVAKYAQKITQQDFADWGKVDLNKQSNLKYREETTEILVDTWLKNTKHMREAAATQCQTQQAAKAEVQEYKATPVTNRPIINIYLRPALNIDAEQMLAIYNWYIENSARPTEIHPVDIDEMIYRLSDCQSNKLPFIVAVMKSKASASLIDRAAEIEAWNANPHPVRNIDPSAGVMTTQEKVVGWASASDFTASDFVERIATDMELYVDPAYRQKGVGRCLMDKMLETLDRGYIKLRGYDFHCAQEIRQTYSSGGARDIHKIVFTLRKWKHPKDFNGRPIRNIGGASIDVKKLDDREDDYDVWLKKWLGSWGFQVEGMLSGVGAKQSRFLDTVFLGRETSWQPEDGRIPDPLPGSF